MSKRTLVILLLAIIMLSVFIVVELKPTSSTEATELEENEIVSIKELLDSIKEYGKITLLHAYAFNPNCPNCDKEAILAELSKVNEYKITYKDELNIIAFNVFDYSGKEMELLQNEINLVQSPTTFLFSRQGEVVYEQIGRISEKGLEKEIRRALNSD